jgi:hypothetical protein
MRNDIGGKNACAVVAAACLALAACGREDTPPATPASTEAAATPLPPAATMHPDDVAGVTASYDCNGIRVDVVRDTVARVNLAVDNIVKIERIQGSVPPTYQDVGLTFATSGATASLEDENGRSLGCSAVEKPGSGSPPSA